MRILNGDYALFSLILGSLWGEMALMEDGVYSFAIGGGLDGTYSLPRSLPLLLGGLLDSFQQVFLRPLRDQNA